MRYGVVLSGTDVSENLELAVAADAAGWDGVFCWEGIYHPDPWTQLTAIAMRTEEVKLGTMLTPAPRRRPWVLAGQCVTLDQLSGGRTILAIGIGAFDPAIGEIGSEEQDKRIRAEILDETIDLLRAMWTGEPVEHSGTHYTLKLPAGPKPVQETIPIWCVGIWPRMRSMRRTLRCDGVLPQADSPETVAAIAEWLSENGKDDHEIISEGTTTPKNAAGKIAPWESAGATWWLEADWAASGEKLRKRIEAGPPGRR